MRIGIDCRLGGLAHAGIGRYCEQLVYHLITGDFESSDTTTWVLFFYNQQQIDDSALFTKIVDNPQVEVRFTPVRHYTISEQILMPYHFYSARLDLLHVPHFNVPFLYFKPFVVTIHDLLWHHYQGTTVTTLPKALYWLKYIGYRIISTQAITRAKQIFVPAHTVATDLKETCTVPDAKITVTYEGVDREALVADVADESNPSQTAASTIDQELLQKPYLLFVGSLYPHKNISVVLKALQELTTNDSLSLIIAGSRNVFQDKVKAEVAKRALTNRVHFVGFVPDAELSQLYSKAMALVQPSLSEGFGLTGIEAMAVGTPVIASDIPIFKELYGSSALLFNPHSVPELIKQISTLTHFSDSERQTIIKAAKKHAAQFEWSSMAQKTYQTYLNHIA